MNPQAPDFLTGGNPSYFNDPNNGMTTAAISQLSSSNFGQLGAQQAERESGRNFQQQEDEIKTNPAFGRNAAVTSALTDRAAETAGAANANAVTKGAEVDANARREGAGLSMQQSQLDMSENELNYQRANDASFGNSFLGHLTQGIAGTAAGALTGGLASGLASNLLGDAEGATGSGEGQGGDALSPGADPFAYNPGAGAQMRIHDASFAKGQIKTIIGKDGTHYTPQANDGVLVGTKLGGNANKLMEAGEIESPQQETAERMKFTAPMELDWAGYKLGHGAFDYEC